MDSRFEVVIPDGVFVLCKTISQLELYDLFGEIREISSMTDSRRVAITILNYRVAARYEDNCARCIHAILDEDGAWPFYTCSLHPEINRTTFQNICDSHERK